MSSVNLTRQIANANACVQGGQRLSVQAEQNMQKVVLGGPGSSGAVGQALFWAQQLIRCGCERLQAGLQEASEEQKAMRQLRLAEGNTDLATA
jgi:hypothetical protein